MIIIANEPTTSWATVTSGPLHFQESLLKMNVNNNGAKVPVNPAVTTPMTWAVKIESAKGTLEVPITNAIAPVITPIPSPLKQQKHSKSDKMRREIIATKV